MRWIGRGLGILAAALAGLVLLGAAFVAVLASPGEHRWIAGIVSWIASGPDTKVEIGGIGLRWPNTLTVTDVSLHDRSGDWLHVDKASAIVRLSRLLRREADISALVIDTVDLVRLPEDSGDDSPISTPLPIRVEQFSIAAFRLEPPVAGELVVLAADGTFQFDAARIATAAHVRRGDGQPGHLSLDVAYGLQSTQLSAKGDLDEPTGLMLDRLLGRREPLQATLSGSGPLSDWHGTLSANSGDLARFDAAVGIAPQGDGYALDATGTLAAQKLLPRDYAGLLGDEAHFSLKANNGTADRIALDRLELDGAGGTLAAQGGLDTAGDILSGTVDVKMPDLSVLAAIAKAPLGGAGSAHLDVSGTVERPVAKIALDLSDPAIAGSHARRATAKLNVVALDDITTAAARFSATGSGAIEGLSLADATLPPGLGDRIDWTLDGTGDRMGEQLHVASLTLADAGMTLDAAMTLAGGTIEGEANLAVPDPSRLALPVSGSARASAAFSAQLSAGTATARLDGTIDPLHLENESLDRLLGGRAAVTATLRRTADGQVSITDLDASGAAVSLAGSADLPPDLKSITARLTADLPNLAAIGPIGDEAPSGRLSANATLAGPWTALTLESRIDATKPSLGAKHLERVQLDLAVPDLSKPAGHVAGSFADTGLAGTMRTDFALRPDGKTLALGGLQLDAAGARIAGSVEIALAGGLARGTVSGTVPDLSPFSGLAGTKLAGRIELKADLSTNSGQTADLSLTGQNLALGKPAVGIARLAASGRMTDLFGRPGGRAEISLTGGTVAHGRLDKALVKFVSSAPGKIHFDIDTSGNFAAPLTMTASGDAVIDGAKAQVTLSRLDGVYVGNKLTLRQPLRVASGPGTLGVTNLALAVGPGSLTGSLALQPQTIAADLHGTNLPVELAARLAGTTNVTGKIAIDATIAGPVKAPHGTFVVAGSALRFSATSQPDLPALSMSARAEWQSGRVDLRGRFDAPNNAAIGFSGSAPLELTPPLAFSVPPQGRLAFKLEGDGALADIADLLPLGEDRLSGRYTVDVDVSGTVGAPIAGGRLVVSDGRYENMMAGTILSGIDLELDGDAQRFVLRRLTANDGGTGRLTGQGSILLSASPLPSVDFSAALQRFRLIRLDDANGTAGGTVGLTGTLDAPRVTADLKIETAEFGVPDRLPSASSPKLNVIRVNSKTGETAPQSQHQPQKAPAFETLGLDLHIEAPGQVFVRGRGLDAEWRGNLVIAGTSAAPIIAGTLTIVRGTFSLLGKDFSLTSGTLSFAGGSPDPLLNVVATASSSDVTVQAVIGGTASSPTINLTSQPALPQDEILSRLLFGTSASQITPVQGLQLAQAAATLTGGGGPDVLGTIRRGLGLDRLSIGSASNNLGSQVGPALTPGAPQQQNSSGTLGGTTLSAGKYVAPGLYVGVEQGASTSSSAVRVEGEITRNLSVNAQAGGPGSQNGQSIGITVKTDY